MALHALRPAEVAEILALTEQWGPVDRSCRKLAHRGTYEGRVWVSASTLRRTLAAAGLVLSEPPARDPTPRVLWPDWLHWFNGQVQRTSEATAAKCKAAATIVNRCQTSW